MSDRFHIVTPVSRPQNLSRILDFYVSKMEPHPFEVRIHLAVQGPEPDPKGCHKVNEIIDMIKDGWVITVSDDTLQHPALFRRVAEIQTQTPSVGAIVFGQLRGPNCEFHSGPDKVHPCLICGGQIVYQRWILGNERFDCGALLEQSDGYLIEKLYQAKPEAFVFSRELLMKFNSLDWE